MRKKPVVIKRAAGATALVLSFLFALSVSKGADDQTEPKQTVELTNIEFRPNRIKASVGERIRFINRDKFNHDVYLVRTANRNDVLIPATTIPAGKSIIVTIDQEGLFTLYCTIHGGMTGKISTTGTFELTEEEKKRAAARKVVPPIVKTGEKLYWGRAQCHHCHMVEDRGTNLRGPNHQDLGFRADAQAKKLGLSSGTEYIVQSIMDPSAYIVEGYSDDMPKVYQPPISLSEDDIKAIVAYLQNEGGQADAWSININPQQLNAKLAQSPFGHGNPEQGRAVFTVLSCGTCHTVGDQKATSLAPELTAIGAYRNWTWLAQSITDPNAEIGANWKDALVYLKPGVFLDDDEEEEEGDEEDDEPAKVARPADTATSQAADSSSEIVAQLDQARSKMEEIREQIVRLEQEQVGSQAQDQPSVLREVASDDSSDSNSDTAGNEDVEVGEAIRGILRKNGADGISVLVGPDNTVVLKHDQVAQVVESKLSRMASNYGQIMTFQQLSDLISYLESLKGPPPEVSPKGNKPSSAS